MMTITLINYTICTKSKSKYEYTGDIHFHKLEKYIFEKILQSFIFIAIFDKITSKFGQNLSSS